MTDREIQSFDASLDSIISRASGKAPEIVERSGFE
jgi:hypothetical protein